MFSRLDKIGLTTFLVLLTLPTDLPMYIFIITQGPVKDQNQILYFIFAVIFIFVCSYFFMDLLVGVLFMNFHEAEAKEKPK